MSLLERKAPEDISKSYSFLTAYLLGADVPKLSLYAEDWRLSKECSIFTKEDAIVRSLMRVRQMLITHFDKITNKLSNLTSLFGKKDHTVDKYQEDMSFLKINDIDLEIAYYRTGDLAKVFDTIQTELHTRVLDIAERYKVPYPKRYVSLFSFPKVTAKTLKTTIEKVSKNIATHGVMLGSRPRTAIALLEFLRDDAILFRGINDLTGYTSDMGQSTLEIDWSEYGGDKREVKIQFDDSICYLGGATIFVDCDNADILSFIPFLDLLTKKYEKTAKDYKPRIELFIDPATKAYWKNIRSFVETDIDIKMHEISRLKDTKSVADISISVEVTKHALKKKNAKICIISSDSDFFGLIHSLEECKVSFIVGIDLSATSAHYSSWLESNNIKKFVLKDYRNDAMDMVVLTSVFKDGIHTILRHLPVYKWTSEFVSPELYAFATKLHLSDITQSMVENVVNNYLSSVSIVLPGGVRYTVADFSVGEVS